MSKLNLFGDDADNNEDNDADVLKINEAYAENYSKWRHAEELQHLKDKYGDDVLESDSDSSDDGYVEPDNPEFDRDFLKTLAAIKSKDPNLLNKDKFFKENYAIEKNVVKLEKPLTILDMERQRLLNNGGESSESDEDNEGYLVRGGSPVNDRKGHIGFEDDNVSFDEDDFIQKAKPKEETQSDKKIVNEAVEYIKGSLNSMSKKQDEKVLKNLKDAWSNNNITDEDEWLKDYFLNKRYLEEEVEDDERPANAYIVDEETISEDEKTLDRLEEFETKYRFRFEEPDEEFIKKYPRIMEDSFRAKSSKRKDLRDAKKQRKEEEIDRKRQEIMQMKALKRKEMLSKMEEIKKIAGNEIEIQECDLDDDFDPDKHDAAMAKMFNEEYFSQAKDEKEKPKFNDDDELYEDYDDWLQKEGKYDKTESNSYEGSSQLVYHDEEEPSTSNNYSSKSVKESVKEEMLTASSSKKSRRRRQNKFSEVLEKEKPVYDPKMGTFDKYYDEYYELDFEDIVAGNPVRFKYRNVAANAFGLSTNEILNARDKELNKWYSMKRLLTFNRPTDQEVRESKNYDHRSSLDHVKRKILPSLFSKDHSELLEADQDKRRKKYLKKKLKKKAKLNVGEDPKEREENEKELDEKKPKEEYKEPEVNLMKDNTKVEEKRVEPNKRNRKKRKRENKKTEDNNASKETPKDQPPIKKQKREKIVQNNKKKPFNNKKKHKNDIVEKTFSGISDKRLSAYGEVPKKIKNKLKYKDKS